MPALSFLNRRAKEQPQKQDAAPYAEPAKTAETLPETPEMQDIPDIEDPTPDPVGSTGNEPINFTARQAAQQSTDVAQTVNQGLEQTAGSIVGALGEQQLGMQRQTGILLSIEDVLKDQMRYFTDLENRAEVKVRPSPKVDRERQQMLDESLLEGIAAGSGDGLLEGLLGGAAGGAAASRGGKNGTKTTVRKKGFKARLAEAFTKMKGSPWAKLLGGAAVVGGSLLGYNALKDDEPTMRPASTTVGQAIEPDEPPSMMPDPMSMLGLAGLLGAGAVGVNKLREKETVNNIVNNSKERVEIRKEAAAPARPNNLQKVANVTGKATSSVAAGAGKLVSKLAMPLTLATEGFSLYNTFTDPNATKKDKTEAVGSSVFGLGGASAGAAAGAAVGSFVPVLGTAVGGLVGGGLGYMAGTDFGKEVADFFTNETGELSLENLESFSEKAAKVVAGPASALTSVFDSFTSKENINKIKQTASSAIDAVRNTKDMMVDFFSDTVSYIMGGKETVEKAQTVVDKAKKESEDKEKQGTSNSTSLVVNNFAAPNKTIYGTGDTTDNQFSSSDLLVNKQSMSVTKAVTQNDDSYTTYNDASSDTNVTKQDTQTITKAVASSIGVVGPTIYNGANKASQTIENIAKSDAVKSIKNFTAANDSIVNNMAAGQAPVSSNSLTQYAVNKEYADQGVTNIQTLGSPSMEAPVMPSPQVAGQLVECMCPQGRTIVKMPDSGSTSIQKDVANSSVVSKSAMSSSANTYNKDISVQPSSASTYNNVSNVSTSVRTDVPDRGSYESIKEVSVINAPAEQKKNFQNATQPVPQQASSKPRIDEIPTVVTDHGMVFLSTGFF